MKNILLIVLCVFSLSSFAQNTEKELVVHKIQGKEYYIHVVDSGNTLFAISRKYAIPREEILKANPRLTETLTIGDRLLIPLNKIRRKDLNESPDMDGNFLIHEVQKKNTLYSLAKEYNVEINDIIVQNPEVENGLKKGMKIKIPVAKIKSEEADKQYITPAAASPYVTHYVEAKETLYSLSKRYNVSIDSLNLVNNGLPGGLQVGQLINIPLLRKYEMEVNLKVDFDSAAIKSTYQVALLLPFFTDLMQKVEDTTMSYRMIERMNEELFSKAKYAIEFYQGFKMAADSMVGKGLNMSLLVLDTGNDSIMVDSIIHSGILDSVDLIVGPLYLRNFIQVADFAKHHKINIVSPVKLSNKILLGNSYVSKVVTSDPVLSKFLGTYMYDSLRFKNMLIVYPDQFEERRRVELLKKQFGVAAELAEDTNRISPLKEVYWNPKNLTAIKSQLKEEEENVIIVPSKDKAFVTRLLTQLNILEDYTFKVIGLAEWESFENIEISYLHNLNVHLVVSEHIDYNSMLVTDFQKNFYKTNNTIPEKYSFLGFDVGMYYLGLLLDTGVNFESMFTTKQQELLGRKFNFIKTGIESGYENHSEYLIKYQDFKKVRLY